MSNACPVCGECATALFLSREQVPVHQNLVMPDRESARAIARSSLEMMVCDNCGFVFNRAFDPGCLLYGDEYDNTQSCSPYFSAYMDDLVRDMVLERQVRNCDIVEVGCGKGEFLSRLLGFEDSGNRGQGFDPSYVGPDRLLDGRLQFHKRYYDVTCTEVPADVVVCRHVIEHVAQPVALLSSVRRALARAAAPRVFFETPCVEWILRNRVIWDFFYEHCSLFTQDSLAAAFEKGGFQVDSIRHVFDGQYLWIEASIPAETLDPQYRAGGVAPLARAYGDAERRMVAKWRERIAQLATRGKVAVWGAGAKGSTFVNLVDADCRLIDCVVDLNPAKQNRFIPGSGHPIVDFTALPARGVTDIILMNPNYRAENLNLLRRHEIAANFVEWK